MAIQSILGLDVFLQGDGVDKSFTLDVNDIIFNMPLHRTPVGVEISQAPVGTTATLDGTEVTLNFEPPLPTGEHIIFFNLLFPSLSHKDND